MSTRFSYIFFSDNINFFGSISYSFFAFLIAQLVNFSMTICSSSGLSDLPKVAPMAALA